MKHVLIQLAVVGLLIALAGVVMAKSAVVTISMSSVNTSTGERGAFYVLDLAIPEDVNGNLLDSVVLEFAVDASPASEEDSLETPVVGVYPVTSEFVASRGDGPVGTVEAPEIDAVVQSSRPVALGEHRVLRMDITDIVRGWMNEPTSNHGLVIGTLTGPEVGTITLNETLPSGDAPVRVTFFYRTQ
jgi:hypothetical protein